MRKVVYHLLLGLLLTLLFSACSQSIVPSSGEVLKGNISISGAYAIYPLMTRWAEEFQRLNPGLSFDIASVGSGKGMEDVLAGDVNIGMISREITIPEEKMGIYPLSVAKDAVFPLVNADNPALDFLMAQGITKTDLKKIYITGQITTWGEVVGNPALTDEIHLYTRSDICGAGATWGLFLDSVQSDLLGIGKFGDPGIVQAVQSDPLGIGFNNLVYAFGENETAPDKTVILPIDLNENGKADPEEVLIKRTEAVNAVASGLYPAPPSRSLYLVTAGKPDGITQAFLRWILTDGQLYVDESGYIQLSENQLENSLQRVR